MVRRILLLWLVVGCCVISAFQPASAARAKRLACPQNWPEDANAALRKATFSKLAENFGPEEFGNPGSWGAEDGDELSCTYSNGRQLLITIPGKAEHCYSGDRKHPKPGEPDDIIYCTYTPTGDPARDAVNPREMEPLTRASLFRGVRLGMTSKDIAETLQATSGVVDDDYDEMFVLPDKQQMHVGYSGHQAIMIQFRLPIGKTWGLYSEVCERFGFPDSNDSSRGMAIWRGADGVRFVVYHGYRFGGRSYQEEVGFLLDGKGLVDLDRQLGQDNGR